MGSALLGHFGSLSFHGIILIAGSGQVIPQAFQGALILGTNDAKLCIYIYIYVCVCTCSGYYSQGWYHTQIKKT